MTYHPFKSFILRSPSLPYNGLSKMLSNKDNLLEAFENTSITDAIYTASPVLYKELEKLRNGQQKSEKDIDRLYLSLERYMSRMSTRCTPFGLFAGCTVGEFGEKNNIELAEVIKRVTRLDMFLLFSIYDKLMSIQRFRHNIRYYPNTTLYPIGGKYRYLEYQSLQAKRVYQITEVEQSVYLKRVLKKVIEGAYIKDIVPLIVEYDITEEDAISFIEELISSQIIIGELDLITTGDDYFTRLVELVSKINLEEGNLLPLLKEIKSLLDRINTNTENNIILYEEIISKLILLEITFEDKYLFQTDMVRYTSSASLGRDVVDEVKSTLKFLNKITPPPQGETLIDKFKNAFYDRYEEQEVALMEALDPELGIGYPPKNGGDISPLIDGFTFPGHTNKHPITSDILQQVLLKKTIECLSKKQFEIELSDVDFKDLEENWNDLPPTIASMISIIKSDEEGVILEMDSAAGTCAANLLSRFSHTDPKIENFVKEITSKEQEITKNAIYAEIVHLPENRIGNILFRPHIRDYELLYMGNSDMERSKLLSMLDLTLAIREGRLIIRSKKLNKEIIPRLTTAHNYNLNGLPVYRFLCDMQTTRGRRSIYFNWGYLESEFEYLPRVRYKSTILSAAIWSIKISEIKYLFNLNDTDLIDKCTEWRKARNIPQHILMPDGDNELFIDWASSISIHSFFSIIKRRNTIRLKEFLFNFKDKVVKNGDALYTNEIILAFYKDKI